MRHEYDFIHYNMLMLCSLRVVSLSMEVKMIVLVTEPRPLGTCCDVLQVFLHAALQQQGVKCLECLAAWSDSCIAEKVNVAQLSL